FLDRANHVRQIVIDELRIDNHDGGAGVSCGPRWHAKRCSQLGGFVVLDGLDELLIVLETTPPVTSGEASHLARVIAFVSLAELGGDKAAYGRSGARRLAINDDQTASTCKVESGLAIAVRSSPQLRVSFRSHVPDEVDE